MTRQFSTVIDITRSSQILNRDLCTIKNWAYQWKMAFNPDPSKQATEIIPTLYFNACPVTTAPFQKHLGLFLDKKLNFGHHVMIGL